MPLLQGDKSTVDEVVDDAWALIVEAIRYGTMTPKSSPDEIKLDSKELIDIAMKLSARKMSKPRGIETPEDYVLNKTRAVK